ncbi:MAG: L-serine ammonia-lyase, iron-sulfur-dependent, subunit alpha [Spirochaetales bacterium]|nr:L-serine ammonia-lyase, iron-sulfur-dependent, subunit alpha [Spirochaetales bacterium]
MLKQDPKYSNYIQILKEELVSAMGCTEPAAIAYVSARARQILGLPPERVLVEVSGNIVKNVKSVLIPNTGGLKGIQAAAAAGIVAGNPERHLEVLSELKPEQREEIALFLKNIPIEVRLASSQRVFEIAVHLYKADSHVRVLVIDSHTNIVLEEKDGKILYEKTQAGPELQETDRSVLNVDDIIDFADTVDPDDVRDMLETQILYNSAISREGLEKSYGADIGRIILKSYGNDIRQRAKAAAAAGSDARMSGCELPVVIVSGSGNQGITASVPVVEYAAEYKTDRESLLRALVVSDLVAIHLKSGIGRLSAYCGVVCAGAAAGAGIAYLDGGRGRAISHTIVNALAIVSGIVCDGAKPSCAAKIAAAVDAGIFGYEMYKNGKQFYGGDGFLAKGVENTIKIISRIGREGMRDTDKEIIQIMLEHESRP